MMHVRGPADQQIEVSRKRRDRDRRVRRGLDRLGDEYQIGRGPRHQLENSAQRLIGDGEEPGGLDSHSRSVTSKLLGAERQAPQSAGRQVR
jgi:hypothetical protein